MKSCVVLIFVGLFFQVGALQLESECPDASQPALVKSWAAEAPELDKQTCRSDIKWMGTLLYANAKLYDNKVEGRGLTVVHFSAAVNLSRIFDASLTLKTLKNFPKSVPRLSRMVDECERPGRRRQRGNPSPEGVAQRARGGAQASANMRVRQGPALVKCAVDERRCRTQVLIVDLCFPRLQINLTPF